MTISSSTRKAGPFSGNDATTTFPFTFKVFAKADLTLTLTDVDGIESTLVLDSDYSIVLNVDQNDDPGGTITYPIIGDPLATGEKLTASGALDELQPTELTNGGGWYPKVVENALDRAVIYAQQLRERLNRTLRFPVSDDDDLNAELPTAALRANKALVFDADGNAGVSVADFDDAALYAAAAAASAASAATSYDLFDDRFLGSKVTDPLVDNDGNALVEGTLYWNSVAKEFRAHNGTTWQVVVPAGNLQKYTYVAGVDFTPGVTTSLVLPVNPLVKANLDIVFDAAWQQMTEFELSGTTVTFDAPIPVGVAQVEVSYTTPLHIGTPSDGTVTDVSVASGAAIDANKLNFLQAGTGAVARSVRSKLRDEVSVKDFGVTLDGVTDDTAAWALAVSYARVTGDRLYAPPGRSLINGSAAPDLLPHAGAPATLKNGIVVPYNTAHGTANRVFIRGAGSSTVLVAGSNDMILLRYADSHGGVSDLAYDANGHTGVVGLAVVPENMQQTTTNVYTIYNVFRGLYMTGCAEAVYMTFGPKVAGSDSGCYYNRYDDIHVYSCLRGFFAPARSASFGGGVGRNLFTNIRVGQNCNTGFQMEAGGTNTLINFNCEGIASGTSPNATPTAFIIKGVGNNFNHMIGCHIEACTRDYEIDTTYTYVTGGSYDTAKCLFTQKFRMVDGASIGTGGYLGAGVPEPLYPLHVITPNGADVRIANAASGSTYWQMVGAAASTVSYDAANATAQQIWLLNAAEKMRLNAAGYLKASNTGTYNSSSASYHELDGSDNVASLIVKSTVAASQSGAGGNIISTFSVTQTGANLFRGENGGVATVLINCNGNITNTNNSYAAISDAKIKQGIVPATSQWSDIKALQARKYHLRSDPTGPLQLGLIAQEVELVSPGLVGETEDFEKVTKQRLELRSRPVVDEDGAVVVDADGRQLLEEYEELVDYDDYVSLGTFTKHVKYSVLYMKAVVALQEAMARIEALEAKVTELQNK